MGGACCHGWVAQKPKRNNANMSQFAPVGLRVPSGFEQLLESLAKEILRAQPTDIITFAAEYFKRKVAQRDERNNQFMDTDVISNTGVMGGATTVPASTISSNITEDTAHQYKRVTAQASDSSSKLQRQDSIGPQESPPPCSDDDSDLDLEPAPSEPDNEQDADVMHSDINADADPNLNATEDDIGSQPEAEINSDLPPPDENPNAEDALSQSEDEPSQPIEGNKSQPQIPDADHSEELPQTSGADLTQELSVAKQDLDEPLELDRSSPQPEPDGEEESQNQEAEKDTENQEAIDPPEEGDD